jgi:excisionase family DNA binding protein
VPEQNDEIMDVRSTARYLKFGERKLYNLIRNHKVPYVKIGGQYRIIRSQLDNWIREQQAGYIPAEGIDEPKALRALSKIENPFKRRLLFVGILTKALEKSSLKPIVVGGHAMEFYTAGGYNTGDIDVVFPDRNLLDQQLTQWGFQKEGRHWINPKLDIYLESPADYLTASERKRTAEVRIDDFSVYLIGVEDLVRDRLNAYVHWKSLEDGRWAKELLMLHGEKLDLKYLRQRCEKERTIRALKKFLRQCSFKEDEAVHL